MNGAAAGTVFLGLLGLWALGPAEGAARAAELTVSLAYEAIPGCPDAAEFKSTVIARMGKDPFREGAPDHVLVRITARPHALDGRLEWRDADGRWTGEQTFPLVTTDCVRLARGIAFALAVQLQLLASTRAASDEDAPAPAPDSPASPPAGDAAADRAVAAPVPPPPVPASPEHRTVPVLVSPPTPEPAHRSGPALLLGVGPSLGVGMSSTPVLLGRVFGALAWRRLSIELAAAATLPSTTRRADGAGFSQHQLLVGAAGCATWPPRWQACLLANVGEVRMSGTDVDRPTSAAVPVVEAGARLAAVQPLGPRLFLSGHLDVMAVLDRWTATLDQVAVWTAPRLAGTLGLDAGARFP